MQETDFEKLIKQLKSEDYCVRRDACLLLGRTGHKQAFEILIKKLDDYLIHDKVCIALGSLGDARAVVPLINKLDYQYHKVREAACYALGEIGDKRAVKPLLRQLNDNDLNVLKAASEALGKIQDDRVVESLIKMLDHPDMDLRVIVSKALGKIRDNRAVEPLIIRLDDPHFQVRDAACEALGEIGDKRAVEPLINRLDYLYRVYEALGKIGDMRALKPLTEKLDDERAVTSEIRAAINIILDKRVGTLIHELDNEDSNIRVAACEELGKIGNKRAVNPLFKQLDNKDSNTRKAACEALGKMKDIRAVEPLSKLLDASDSEIRTQAFNALVKIGGKQAAKLIITRFGFYVLIKWFDCNDPAVRITACEELSKVPDTGSVQVLIKWLADSKPSVRKVLCDALENQGEERLAAAFRELNSKAMVSLAIYRELRMVEPLLKLATKGDDKDRRNAQKALKGIFRVLKPDSSSLVCLKHIARFVEYSILDNQKHKIPYYGCRICKKTSDAIINIKGITAVINKDMKEKSICNKPSLRVNYFKRVSLFDFDNVEIIKASDYEVEKFCLKVGNDGDEWRKKRYKNVECIVHESCGLSKKVIKILQDLFSNITIMH